MKGIIYLSKCKMNLKLYLCLILGILLRRRVLRMNQGLDKWNRKRRLIVIKIKLSY